MLNRIIDFSLRNRLLVVVAALACVGLGVASVRQLDIDAFPDTTPVQVQINSVAPALGPEEVETQITAPIEQGLSGVPKLQGLRSVSKFGLSQVVVTFEDGTDIYFARQVVNERLGAVQLPVGIDRPKMGPVSTGLGEVFHYVVTGTGDDATDLRTIHDWVIRPQMRAVRGTAEVNSWGGYEKQYQVRIDPARLVKHDLTFEQVVEAVGRNNRNVGGGTIRQNGQSLLVHGKGRTTTAEQIGNIVIAAGDGVPVRVKDVADVQVGSEVRRGAVTADGKGEVVLGLGFMTTGENSHTVTWNMKHKLDEVRATLPRNYRVEPVYDRTELVEYVIRTVKTNLFEGGVLVVAVLFAFLGNLRAAAVVALAIPLSMMFAFTGMLRWGIAASLLSLGAIDFGLVVDSSVVMVENCVRHLAHTDRRKTKLEVIRDAAVEVRRPTLYGELIIMIVYLPILTLEGIEGKLFRPIALTVIFALVGSMIASMTLMPVLASLVLPRRVRERESLLMRLAHAVHAPVRRPRGPEGGRAGGGPAGPPGGGGAGPPGSPGRGRGRRPRAHAPGRGREEGRAVPGGLFAPGSARESRGTGPGRSGSRPAGRYRSPGGGRRTGRPCARPRRSRRVVPAGPASECRAWRRGPAALPPRGVGPVTWARRPGGRGPGSGRARARSPRAGRAPR